MIQYFVLKRFKKIFLLLAIAFSGSCLFSSCKTTSQSQYFNTLKRDTTLAGTASSAVELRIKKGDLLAIKVSSLSAQEDALFNGSGSSISATAAPSSAGYQVMQDGTILLHRIGNVKAEGFTKNELANKIQTGLLPFLKEPIVTINFLNHKVTVFGEVAAPKVISMTDDRLSLIDALVLSGDLTAVGKRNDVVVIRDNGPDKEVKHINLEDHSIFSSSWFYLQPDDVVLVNADTEKYVKEEKRRKLQNNLSLAASGISLLLIILSRVVK